MGLLDDLLGLFDNDGSSSDRNSRTRSASSRENGNQQVISDSSGDTPELANLGPAEFRAQADETARAYAVPSLDFTLDSLERLDAFARRREDPFVEPGEHRSDSVPLMGHGQHVLEFGSYFGEVLANNFDGDWVVANDFGDDRGDVSGWAVAVPVARGTTTVGVFEITAFSFVEEPAFGTVAAALRSGNLAGELGSGAVPEPLVPAGLSGDVASGRPPDVGSPGVTAGAEVEMCARAEAFAEAWPDDDLDGSITSLLRLDDLVENELRTGLGGSSGRRPAATDRQEGIPRIADPPDGLGPYLGQVFVDAYDGRWHWTHSGGWVVVLGDEGGREITFDARTVLRTRLAGRTTFVAEHDALLGQSTLDAPKLVIRVVTQRHREAATALVGSCPEHKLDFSVPSLVRLDELAGEREIKKPGDAEVVEQFGGYFAEVLRQNHDADWRHIDADWRGAHPDDAEVAFEVRGEERAATLEPAAVARAGLTGETQFVQVYAHMAAKIGLESPLN